MFFSMPSLAIIVSDFSNMCGIEDYDKMYATFEPITYNCAVGYYLPADTLGCVPCPLGYTCAGGAYAYDDTIDQGITISTYTCSNGYYLPANHDGCVVCPNGATCVGGNFTFNDTFPQGIKHDNMITQNQNNLCSGSYDTMYATFEPITYNCAVGYYLPADGIECTLCPADNICSGGTYTYNETTDQGIVACTAPTPYAPSGSDSVCYPHVLHVDDGVVYLRSTKLTSPSLHIRIEDDVFYANMTTIPTRMNKDSVRYFHSQWDDNHYYICDDTTYPGE